MLTDFIHRHLIKDVHQDAEIQEGLLVSDVPSGLSLTLPQETTKTKKLGLDARAHVVGMHVPLQLC
jgi:hypothetical protein